MPDQAAGLHGGHGLADFFDGEGQRKADIAFPGGAEAGAGGADDAGLLDEGQAEVHAVRIALRHGGPDEHRTVAVRDVPADGAQAAAQGIAAALVLGALGTDSLTRAGQGRDGRLLDRDEHAEINLGAQFLAGSHDVGAAHQEADPRTGHIEALAEREELHRAVPGAGDVEDAVAFGAVKDDVAVSVVVDEKDLVPVAEIHDLAVDFRRADTADRVGGQRDDHVLGAAGDLLGDFADVGQEVVFPGQMVIIGHTAAQPGPRDEHRVARVGKQHGVAVVEQRHAQVADAVLAARKAHDPVGGDVLHPKPAAVVVTDGLQHLGQVAQRILPVFAVRRRLDQGLLDVGHRFKIRRAHRQIVQLFARCFEGYFFIVQGRKNFRSEQLQTLGKVHRKCHSETPHSQ